MDDDLLQSSAVDNLFACGCESGDTTQRSPWYERCTVSVQAARPSVAGQGDFEMRTPRKSSPSPPPCVALGLAGAVQAREVYAGNLMPNTGSFPRTGAQRIQIIVDQFSSREETERLVAVLETKGPRALETAMSKLEVGRLQVGTGLSYPIATAHVFEDKELSTRRLVLIVPRPIAFGEYSRGGRSKDYAYTLVELAMDGPGIDDGGSGEMLAAAKIELEKDGTVHIENLEAQPRRIVKVTRSE